MNKEKNKKQFYVTTPIFYPNDKLHLGHAYTVTIADIIARFKKIKDYEVYFQTGSDEHGEKIEKTSNLNNITPQELVDKNVLLFKKLWKKMNITKDHFFMRTSFSSHKKKVQEIFKQLLLKNDIYLGKYRGSYCVICEEYVLNKKNCNFCNSKLKIIEEDAYFLKVEKYRHLLIEHYKNNENFLSPKSAVNELFQSFLEKEIPDLCITRSYMKWGVSVPGNTKMTIYVWIDALCNYMTSEEGEKFFSNSEENYKNSEIVQIIGKDILRFHAVYWISLLKSLNKRIPNKLISHGWILNSGSKMSKSKGNVINPLDLLKNYKSDVLRTYFAAKIMINQDGILSEELIDEFYQSFFVNNLGNLFSRVMKMNEIYSENTIGEFIDNENEFLIKYRKNLISSVISYELKMENYQISQSFNEIQNIINNSNKLISEIFPWNLYKENKKSLLNETLIQLINGIKIIAFLLLPIAPNVSEKILNHLEINKKILKFKNVIEFSNIENKKLKPFTEHLFK